MENTQTSNPAQAQEKPINTSAAAAQPVAAPTPVKTTTATGATPPKSAFDNKPSGTPPMQSFNTPKKSASAVKVIAILLLMAAFGVGTGYGVASVSTKPGQKSALPNTLNANAPAKGETYGSDDTAAYKDTAEGVLKEGGIEGEGQYHLERPGGESQNVYMTSSTVDLSKFIDKKIKVWGATQTAQTAGWLMDVGRVEVQ